MYFDDTLYNLQDPVSEEAQKCLFLIREKRQKAMNLFNVSMFAKVIKKYIKRKEKNRDKN